MKATIMLVLTTAVAFCGSPARADQPDLQIHRNCKTTLPPEPNKEPAAGKAETDKLNDSLAECNGVLRPPAVGDDMAVPPPRTGAKTPVLPPGSVPEQTPKG
jgi:hypothetical protein